MSTTAQHLAARHDPDLLTRAIATAEMLGVENPQQSVEASIGKIVSTPIEVSGQSTTVTAVHAYADAVRKDYLADTRAMAPGLNPGAVTDDHLLAAVTAVFL